MHNTHTCAPLSHNDTDLEIPRKTIHHVMSVSAFAFDCCERVTPHNKRERKKQLRFSLNSSDGSDRPRATDVVVRRCSFALHRTTRNTSHVQQREERREERRGEERRGERGEERGERREGKGERDRKKNERSATISGRNSVRPQETQKKQNCTKTTTEAETQRQNTPLRLDAVGSAGMPRTSETRKSFI